MGQKIKAIAPPFVDHPFRVEGVDYAAVQRQNNKFALSRMLINRFVTVTETESEAVISRMDTDGKVAFYLGARALGEQMIEEGLSLEKAYAIADDALSLGIPKEIPESIDG